MKKLIILSALMIGAFTSCKDNEREPSPTPQPVQDPAPATTPQPRTSSTTTTTTTTSTTEDPDGTSVSIGEDGFSLESKKGDDKSNVRVTRKEVTVEKSE